MSFSQEMIEPYVQLPYHQDYPTLDYGRWKRKLSFIKQSQEGRKRPSTENPARQDL